MTAPRRSSDQLGRLIGGDDLAPTELLQAISAYARTTPQRRGWLARLRLGAPASRRVLVRPALALLLVAALALALLAVLSAGGFDALRNLVAPAPTTTPLPSASPTPSLGATDQASLSPSPPTESSVTFTTGSDLPRLGTTTGTVELAGGDRLATAAFDAVWATNTATGELVRIDATTGEVSDRIAVNEPPLGDEQYIFNAVPGDSRLWLSGNDGSLVAFDPAALKVVDRHMIGGVPYQIALTATDAWVTDFGSGAIIDVDLATGSVKHRIDEYGAAGIAVTADGVWVSTYYGGELLRIDPTAATITERIPIGTHITSIVAAGEDLWLTGNQGFEVSRFRIADRTLTHVTTEGLVALAGGDVFVVTPDGSLARLDSTTLAPAAVVDVGSTAGAAVFDGDEFWVDQPSDSATIVARVRPGG